MEVPSARAEGEQNTGPRLHCSAVPGDTELCLPSVENQFKMSREEETGGKGEFMHH